MMLIDPLGKVVHVYAWWYCQIVGRMDFNNLGFMDH